MLKAIQLLIRNLETERKKLSWGAFFPLLKTIPLSSHSSYVGSNHYIYNFLKLNCIFFREKFLEKGPPKH